MDYNFVILHSSLCCKHKYVSINVFRWQVAIHSHFKALDHDAIFSEFLLLQLHSTPSLMLVLS